MASLCPDLVILQCGGNRDTVFLASRNGGLVIRNAHHLPLLRSDGELYVALFHNLSVGHQSPV